MLLPKLRHLRAIVFDRDGTLNASGPDANGGYILRPEDLVLRPGVRDALCNLHDRGVLLYVFSQQNCVTKKLIDEAGIDAIHARMNADLSPARIAGFYFNTQAGAGPDWSKPGPGMLHAVLAAVPGLGPSNCLVIGDAARDADSAAAAGLPFAFIESDQGSKAAEALATGLPFFGSLGALLAALA